MRQYSEELSHLLSDPFFNWECKGTSYFLFSKFYSIIFKLFSTSHGTESNNGLIVRPLENHEFERKFLAQILRFTKLKAQTPQTSLHIIVFHEQIP